MTKFTLLAAASVAAIAVAGGAQAGTITGAVGNASVTPFRIASERTDASTSTAAGAFVVTNTYGAANTVAAGTTQNYRVTFTVTNGTIASPSLTVANGNATPITTGVSIASGGTTANSATFIVTVTAAGTPIAFDRVILASTLTSPSEQNVAVASTTELLAGGVATNIDTTAATTLVAYSPLVSGFTVTARSAVAALPGYTTFSSASPATSPLISTSQAIVAENYTVGANTGTFYAGLETATPVVITVGGLINGGSIVVSDTASQLNTLVADLGTYTTGPVAFTSLGLTPTRAAGSATFALDNTNADLVAGGTVDLSIAQPSTAVVIAADSFTAAFSPTFISGYTAPTAAYSAASGSIALAGTNYIAPWVAGSQAGGAQTVVRLTNSTGTAIQNVQLRLINAQARAAGATSGPGAQIANQTCSTQFTIQANGEIQFTGASLTACFGNFLRGDLQITVQSDATNLTAKARNVAADGTVFEQTLNRASGSAN